MTVSLVAISRPTIEGVSTPGELLAYCARVSSSANQMNHETGPRLIRSLLRRQEWSPLEMVSLTMEIVTTRDIARQILRHRSFSFQEFCVAGSTMVTFDLPGALKRGKRQSYKRSIEKLYATQQAGGKLPSMLRVFDEGSRTFVTASIREVFQTGVKPTFKITLENGRVIESTKEHRFLTETGFVPLEAAVGLKLIGRTAVMEKPDTKFACNGTPAYRDASWLAAAKSRAIASGEGLAAIARESGMSTHTIRKWLRLRGVQFTKREVASYSPIWNKGRTGYKLGPHSPRAIEKMRKSARRGSDSNLWRGGASRSERLKIADWCAQRRTDFLRAANYRCARCESNSELELHHMLTVAARPDLAYEPSNIEVLCKSCHRGHHRISGDAKTWRENSKGNRLTVHWSKIRSVEYVGEQMTYDLEVNHDSHNFVGNGIVVHNSQRYSAVEDKPVYREARMQHPTDRQASVTTADADLADGWHATQNRAFGHARAAYEWALANGIAKEQARAVLPEGMTLSKLYMAGTLRSWWHYVELRTQAGTQAEHRAIANDAKVIVLDQFPELVA